MSHRDLRYFLMHFSLGSDYFPKQLMSTVQRIILLHTQTQAHVFLSGHCFGGTQLYPALVY